jgi:hypothetical protein
MISLRIHANVMVCKEMTEKERINMHKRHKDEESAHPSWGTLKGEIVSKEQAGI